MKPVDHQFEDKLLEFAYGELPAPEASAVDSHVRGCARCSASLAEIKGVRSTFQALPMEAAPDAGLESLLAYAEQTARRNAAGPGVAPAWWRRWVAPLAGVAALALVGIVALRAQDEGSVKRSLAEEGLQAKAPPSERATPPSASAPEVPAAPVLEQKEQQDPATLDALGKNDEAQIKQEKVLRREAAKGAGGGLSDGFFAEGKTNPKKKSAPSKPAPAADNFGDDQAPMRDDYSNVAQRGANTRATLTPPKVAAGEASGPPSDEKAGKKAERKDAPEPKPAVVAAAQPPPAAAPPQQQSLGLGLSTGGTPGGRSGSGSLSPSTYRQREEEDRAYEAESLADKKRLDADQEFETRRKASALETLLTQARSASNAGDRQGEIKLCKAVLAGGATGSSRLEALHRLCTSLEALGQEAAADPFCDAMVSEFPTSAYAKAFAERRNRTQMAPAPMRSKANKKAAEVDSATEAPDKAKSADKPASAY